jgi:hypothetical protein
VDVPSLRRQAAATTIIVTHCVFAESRRNSTVSCLDLSLHRVGYRECSVGRLPSLFAGKVHARLCRAYLKGRDWYDFIWYTARRTPINYPLLTSALQQSGPWQGLAIQADRDWCTRQLREKIQATDWRHARDDVRRFLKSHELPSLDVWSTDFFLWQIDKLA